MTQLPIKFKLNGSPGKYMKFQTIPRNIQEHIKSLELEFVAIEDSEFLCSFQYTNELESIIIKNSTLKLNGSNHCGTFTLSFPALKIYQISGELEFDPNIQEPISFIFPFHKGGLTWRKVPNQPILVSALITSSKNKAFHFKKIFKIDF